VRELRESERLRQREKPLLWEKPLLCGSAPCHTEFHYILLYDIRLVLGITLHYIIVVPSLGFRVQGLGFNLGVGGVVEL